MARRGKDAPARDSAPPARVATPRASQPPTTLVTVALALALTLVGLAGYGAALLLRETLALRPTSVAVSPASLSTFVCDTLQHQEYQRLVTSIDPAPVPPTVTDAFDPTATVAALRASDASEGKVVSCVASSYAPGSVVTSPGITHVALTLRRSGSLSPRTESLTLAQMGGQRGWMIERDSGFLLALAIPTPTG